MQTGTSLTVAAEDSIEKWAIDIGADLNEGAECWARAGRKLIESKEQLGHGNFLKLVDRLKLGIKTAQRLMAISRSPMLSNASNTTYLPTTFSALLEVLRLEDDNLADAIGKGLVFPNLKVKAARAIAGAYNKPEGEIIGGAQHMAPTVKEAREIARATGRFVRADDNRIYSGATAEETSSYAMKRDAAFDIIAAIETLGNAPTASGWFASAERHWFHEFRYSALDDAIEWLTSLKAEMGVVDAE